MNVRHGLDTFRGYRTPRFRIIEHRRWWAIVSGTLLALSVVGLVLSGLNFSIDFTGGSLIQYRNVSGVSIEEIRGVLADYGREEAEIQVVAGDQISIRTSALTDDLSAEERAQLVDDLATQAGVTPSDVSIQVVGPTWGSQISRQAVVGLVVVLLAIAAYITFRFEWKMALTAQLAMVHDVVITAGVYALTGREVSPATVIAILTILGFSLYDTVVIFDKVKENTESAAMLAKDTYSGVANASLNSVFMRSVNTSLVVLLPILSLLLFGGQTLKNFAFAMLIGVAIGAYSSIFIAVPILAALKEREPRFRQLRARLESRSGSERRLRTVSAEASDASTETAQPAPAAVGTAAATRATARGQGPRPGAKGRRKPPAKRRRR
jgi:preprotein translocase subunit SecF